MVEGLGQPTSWVIFTVVLGVSVPSVTGTTQRDDTGTGTPLKDTSHPNVRVTRRPEEKEVTRGPTTRMEIFNFVVGRGSGR